jgi:hypothetical protein
MVSRYGAVNPRRGCDDIGPAVAEHSFAGYLTSPFPGDCCDDGPALFKSFPVALNARKAVAGPLHQGVPERPGGCPPTGRATIALGVSTRVGPTVLGALLAHVGPDQVSTPIAWPEPWQQAGIAHGDRALTKLDSRPAPRLRGCALRVRDVAADVGDEVCDAVGDGGLVRHVRCWREGSRVERGLGDVLGAGDRGESVDVGLQRVERFR